ncbi:DinB family protein [Paenibacillus sp. MMS20-IR301]|uniref:DinB family protein n=1 Tax=Paenibacillus sp. MMS20-IR301 TaxID=2895946 RepID=UPI0028E8AF97|nr:DinB family protein [Paenibacillus sp. MMS20-IR301]WNS40864.1 DinB family protein [Paenibacillus sp. MMS20-IR301]
MSSKDLTDYLNTAQQLAQALDGLSGEQLKWKEGPASWSITEVLAHLADHSIVVSFRIRDILADTQVQLPAFNQDAWVSGQHSNQGTAEESLNVFRSLLHYNSLLLGRLGSGEWEKSGINFKGETVRISDIVRSFTAHVQTHLAQIERVKRGAEAAGSLQR